MRMMLKMGTLVATALLSFACSSEPKGASGDDDKVTAEEETGTLSLELVGQDRAGVSYRLRNATFHINEYGWGYPYPGYGGATGGGGTGSGETISVSSETDPDAPFIRTRLLPGTYFVTLEQPGWSIERITPTGPEAVEQAVLLSEATQYAYVYDRSLAQVTYNFGVDGTLIDFRHGDLDIGITIERPGDEPADGGVGTGGWIGAGGTTSTGGVPIAGGKAGF